MYHGRLAPSPTGAQHLGNARTHLIAYWVAQQSGGRLSLRIDDLDSPRVKQWASDQAIEDLKWLGIRWSGEIAYQSETLDSYRKALEVLIDANQVYPCTCSRKDIEQALSAPHESRYRGEGPVYPGTCSSWSGGDALPDKPYCWRFRSVNREFAFEDEVMGRQTCNPFTELGDFPITQKNGSPSYQLAVVVDDHLIGVNHIVRGNDLVASTFRQSQLHEKLGWDAPTYAHVPLVISTDGRRLAKRHGDTRLSHYREQGVRPEQIVGWAAASLGLVPEGTQCRADDVVERFQLKSLPLKDTQVDLNQFPK